MCSFLAIIQAGSFSLTMNRDDEYTRTHTQHISTEELIYPLDTRSQGTWIVVSKKGKVAALLNHEGKQQEHARSRGELALLAVQEKLPTDFATYNPFQLFFYDIVKQQGTLSIWDGEKLQEQELGFGTYILSSSSLGFVQEKLVRLENHKVSDFTTHTSKIFNPSDLCVHAEKIGTIAHTEITWNQKEHLLHYTTSAGFACEKEKEKSFSVSFPVPKQHSKLIK